MDYKTVAVGGTFDRFHKGHEAFLSFAFTKGEHVIIGVTTDEFIAQNKKDAAIEPFEKRKKSLVSFLENKQLSSRAYIIPIDSLFGPTLSKGVSIDALVVTENTKVGALEINNKRQEAGLSSLPIIICPLIAVGATIISSSKIRKGEMDKEGEPFIDSTWYSTSYRMPEGLRLLLHKPFGTLLQNNLEKVKKMKPEKIVTVGDVTTKKFLERGIIPFISIIDFVIERKRKYTSVKELGFTGKENIIHMFNPPSTIAKDIWMILRGLVEHQNEKKSNIILVDGEEDLLVLPLILVLPVGFYIFYGQPKAGYVEVVVTTQLKEDARNLFRLFKEIV